MLVKMRINITGWRNGEPWPPVGGTVDVDDHEAVDLIAAGYAEEVHDAEAPALEDGDRPAEDSHAASPDDVDATDAPDSDEAASADEVSAADELAELVDADGTPVDVPDGGPAADARAEEIVDLDDLDREQLAVLAEHRGVKVHHNASAATIRKALRADEG